MAIHVMAVIITCISLPLVMGSNIWPIAAVFWMVLTIPVAVGTGALIGLLVKGYSGGAKLTVLIVTAVILAVIAGVVMSYS